MKLVNFEVKEIQQPKTPIEACQFLERIGRICWKSEDRITEDSYKKFLTMIFNKGHLSVFEHVWLKTSFYLERWSAIKKCFYEFEFDEKYTFSSLNEEQNKIFIHINLRSLIDNWNNLGKLFPIMEFWKKFQMESDLHLQKIELKETSNKIELSNEVITLYIKCNRGISHQLVRHRSIGDYNDYDFISPTQESSRFVNYQKRGDVEYILPFYIDNEEDKYEFAVVCRKNEDEYFKALERGLNPEEARNYLMQHTATSMYLTAPIFAWKKYIHDRRNGGQKEHQIICDVLENAIKRKEDENRS